MHVSGLAFDCDLDKGTFMIDVDVNVSPYKNARNGGGVNTLCPAAPFLCMIPESRTHAKPMPHEGRFVSIIGTLTDVTFIQGDRHQGVERFHIVVEHMASLGHWHPHANGNGKSVSHRFSCCLLTFLNISSIQDS